MRREIYTIHDRDLELLLNKLGLTAMLRKGEIKCAICGCVITKENLGSILPLKKELIICCDKIDCLKKLMEVRGRAAI